MKRTKKIAALVLAMVMAFSLMAVTASAYSAEDHQHTHVCSADTIQPRVVGTTCLYCGRGMWLKQHTVSDDGVHHGTFVCINEDCSNTGYTVYLDW